MIKRLVMAIIIVAALMTAFLAGAAVMAHSTTTVHITSNLREAGEEENIIEETILWENVEVETF